MEIFHWFRALYLYGLCSTLSLSFRHLAAMIQMKKFHIYYFSPYFSQLKNAKNGISTLCFNSRKSVSVLNRKRRFTLHWTMLARHGMNTKKDRAQRTKRLRNMRLTGSAKRYWVGAKKKVGRRHKKTLQKTFVLQIENITFAPWLTNRKKNWRRKLQPR